MKFKVSSAALLKGLTDVSKAIPAKSPLPILENFLFCLKENVLEITASDQELTLRTRIEVETLEAGSIAVPARQIIELFKTLPDQPVTITTKGESTFECVWSSGNSSLPYFVAADYPEIKGVEEVANTAVFPAETIVDGIAGTIYATADDDIRPAMSGIFFDMTQSSTTLVASDAHKLVCYSAPDVKVTQDASIILHKKAAAALRATVNPGDGEVKLSFDDKTAVFEFGSTMMVCRLIVGRYPRYRDVIPQNNSNVLKIDRNLLLGTVRRVAVCSNKASNHVKFDLKSGSLEITAQDLGFSTSAYEKLECEFSDTTLSIGFKSAHLIEILSNMTCDTVMMKFADSNKAALILPSEEDAENERICGIIMPIKVA